MNEAGIDNTLINTYKIEIFEQICHVILTYEQMMSWIYSREVLVAHLRT